MSAPVRPRLLVVFYANPDYYPPTFSAVSLLNEHFDVHVVCRKSDREMRLWPAGVRLDRRGPGQTQEEQQSASRVQKLGEFAAFVLTVRKALSRYRPSVVLAYEPHALAALSLAGNRAPLVYQRHEVEERGQHDPRSLGGWIAKYALLKSREASLVVFPEAQRAAYYASFAKLSHEPLIVPNFPLLRSFPRPDFDALLPERARARSVLYRGAMGPANGIREAVRTLTELDRTLSLRLFGPGNPKFLAEISQQAIDQGVDDRLDLAGFVSLEELNRQTQRASVGLMLYQPVDTNWTFNASANNKLYEYAACGVPALVPNRSAFRDFLAGEEWVELVDEQDPRSIADGVRRILSTPEAYEARSRLARRRFEERFNYEAVFGPMLTRIRELARSRA